MLLSAIRDHRNCIHEIARNRGARRIRVFGSVARGEGSPTSDVDFLVDMEPGRSLLDLIGLQLDLQDLLGRPVDVVAEGGVSPYLAETIEREARPL